MNKPLFMINITNLPYCRNIDKTVGFRQRPAATAVAHGGNCYSTVEGGSVNRCFKTPVIIANTGYRKGPSQKLSYGKIAALFLHIPTGRGDRPASPPDFSASCFSRKFSDLEAPRALFTEPPSMVHPNGLFFRWGMAIAYLNRLMAV
jgi:hypothetical protein